MFGTNRAAALQQGASLSPLVTLRCTGLTGTPWPCRLFWGGESAPAPASVHDEAGELPAALQLQEQLLSAQTHWHNTHSLSGISGFDTAQLLLSAGLILEHNKVTRNRFNQSCVFSCYGNRSQEPKSCPVTRILCPALS